MKNFITIGIAVASVVSVHSQEVKFGKFTSGELAKEESQITTSAPAEVLYSKAKYTIDWNKMTGELEKKTIVHYRVKVFDKDKSPTNFLTVEIPLYKGDGSSRDKLLNLKASTFNSEGNGLKEHKVNKNDIFQKDVHNYLSVQTFTFPNVKNGSILEFTYEIISPFYYNVGTWYFQENIPVVKSDLILETHEYLNYQ